MQHQFILAGFGGQGILSMGKMLAYAGLLSDKNVSWLPSYGPEMRGGTANCCVVISDNPVGSPILNNASAIIAMNGPSFDKFESYLDEGGIAIVDSSLVHRTPTRDDIEYIEIPATEMANEAGNATYAGIVLLGKLLAKTGCVEPELFEKALEGILPERKHFMIPEEMEMLKKGAEY